MNKGTRFVLIEDKKFIIIMGFFFTVIILGLETIAVQDMGVLAATSDLGNIPSSKNTQDNFLPTDILSLMEQLSITY